MSRANCMLSIQMECLPGSSKTNTMPWSDGSGSWNIRPLTRLGSVSAIWTSSGMSSIRMVPRGNSTDSSLLSLGMDSRPTMPMMTAAIVIGTNAWARVVTK